MLSSPGSSGGFYRLRENTQDRPPAVGPAKLAFLRGLRIQRIDGPAAEALLEALVGIEQLALLRVEHADRSVEPGEHRDEPLARPLELLAQAREQQDEYREACRPDAGVPVVIEVRRVVMARVEHHDPDEYRGGRKPETPQPPGGPGADGHRDH